MTKISKIINDNLRKKDEMEQEFIILNEIENLKLLKKSDKIIESYLKKIPDEFWENKYFCLDALRKTKVAFNFIPNKFMMDYKILEIALHLLKHNDIEKKTGKVFFENNILTNIELLSLLTKHDPLLINRVKNETVEVNHLRKRLFEQREPDVILKLITKELSENTFFAISLLESNTRLLRNKKIMDSFKFDYKLLIEHFNLLTINLQQYFIHKIPEEYMTKELYVDFMRNNYSSFFLESKSRFKNDLDVVLLAVRQSDLIYKSLPENLKRNKTVILTALEDRRNIWKYIPKDLKKDPDILKEALNSNYDIWDDLSVKQKNDPNVLIRYFSKRKITTMQKVNLPEEILDNILFANILIKKDTNNYKLFSDRVKEDYGIITLLLSQNEYEYKMLPEHLKNDIQFNLSIIKDGLIRDYKSLLKEDLFYHQEIVLATIAKDKLVTELYIREINNKEKKIVTNKNLIYALHEEINNYSKNYGMDIRKYTKIYNDFREQDLKEKLNNLNVDETKTRVKKKI